MAINQSHPKSHHERPLIEKSIDAYRADKKLKSDFICPKCHAVYSKGRWQWMKPPEDAQSKTCPACQREDDGLPAGYLILEGERLNQYADEILKLVHHIEAHERSEHPLKRIMGIERNDTSITITTTDMHLAHGLSKAIESAYHGQLTFQYNEGENLLRAYWKC
jgi:hypothetical protein